MAVGFTRQELESQGYTVTTDPSGQIISARQIGTVKVGEQEGTYVKREVIFSGGVPTSRIEREAQVISGTTGLRSSINVVRQEGISSEGQITSVEETRVSGAVPVRSIYRDPSTGDIIS